MTVGEPVSHDEFQTQPMSQPSPFLATKFIADDNSINQIVVCNRQRDCLGRCAFEKISHAAWSGTSQWRESEWMAFVRDAYNLHTQLRQTNYLWSAWCAECVSWRSSRVAIDSYTRCAVCTNCEAWSTIYPWYNTHSRMVCVCGPFCALAQKTSKHI